MASAAAPAPGSAQPAPPAPPVGAAPPMPPMTGVALAVTALALALGTFMQVLDTTIANVSLPTIAGNLGVSADSSTWVITAFAVANGVAVPLTGWLMGRFGIVRTFLVAVAAFTFSSFLCGIAWNLSSLIVFRILQGASSGPMVPGSQALLISIFPPEKRATALGIWSMTTLIAPIMGPLLGGYISDNYHWSWIFLINVPFGTLCGIVCWRQLKGRETPSRKIPIDRTGLVLLILWVGALQMMLDLGKNDDWFNASRIVVLAVIACIGFLVWLVWETTDAHPAVNLHLFRSRNFAIGSIAFALGYAVFFANILILPLWTQTQLGYTATWSGLIAAPGGLVAVVLTPFTARMVGKYDARIIATCAFIAFAVSYGMRGNFTTQTDLWNFILPQLVQGIAMSGFFLAMLTICLDGIPPDRLPQATGLSNFTRITAGAFAASLVTTMWDRRQALHQSRLSEAIGSGAAGPYADAAGGLARLGLDPAQSAAVVTRNMAGQAYLLASTDLFWLSSVLCGILIVFVWMTKRPGAAAGPVAAD